MPAKKDSNNKDAAQALKAILAEKTPPPFLLVLCPDRVRQERVIGSVLKKFCPEYDEKSRRSDSLTQISAESFNTSNIQNLSDNINSLSLFSKQKFILITDVEELNSSLNKKILDILEETSPDTCVILGAKKLASNSQILTFFRKNQALIELPELKNMDLTRWVEKELKTEGVTFSDEILPEAIIQSCDADPDKIAELISRLALFVDDEKASLNDLNSLSKHAPDASEFALIDNLPNKRMAWKSELLLTQIFKAGKNPFALLGLISRTYNNYMQIAYLREKGLSAQQIRTKLNISPWIFNKQFETSKNYSVQKLQKSLESILMADSKLKNRSLGDEAIFSALIHNL
jgi:DNA polymerase III delta subunit